MKLLSSFICHYGAKFVLDQNFPFLYGGLKFLKSYFWLPKLPLDESARVLKWDIGRITLYHVYQTSKLIQRSFNLKKYMGGVSGVEVFVLDSEHS